MKLYHRLCRRFADRLFYLQKYVLLITKSYQLPAGNQLPLGNQKQKRDA